MTHSTRWLLTLGLALCAGVLIFHRSVADKATTKELGGAYRYLTSLSTDKPIYRAGEKVYVRGVLLNAAHHTPLPAEQPATAAIQIRGPKGDIVAAGTVASENSVWGFGWDVPAGQAGGEYTIKVSYPWNGHAPAERKFDIRAYRAPRLKSQIVFLRDGYGPGEKVSATLHVERAEGGLPEGAKVSVVARVDGTEIHGADARVDAQGNCAAEFNLPAEIARGEGTLALTVQDGGVVETATKTIPILLQTLDIKFYPEGGDLIAGVANRVYFEARQPNGKPADIEGEIIPEMSGDEAKDIVRGSAAHVRTEHEGRGRFLITPNANAKWYALHITSPAGIKANFPLPALKASGVVIRTAQEAFKKGEPVVISVITQGDFKNLKATLSKREEEISASAGPKAWASDKPGNYSVTLDAKDADGVLRVTIRDDDGAPLAERLVYREPAKRLTISITPDKPFHVPGENVKLTVKTTDADGKPVSAVVGLSATDDSVLEMIEKREQAPRLPVMVLLEPEVRELADASVYLDAKNPKAPLAVDLLLGTQGWRRFAFQDSVKFVAEHGESAQRVLALRVPPLVAPGRGWGGGKGSIKDGEDFFMVLPGPDAAEKAAVVKTKSPPPPPVVAAPLPVKEAAAAAVAEKKRVLDKDMPANAKMEQAVAANDEKVDRARIANKPMSAAKVAPRQRNDFVYTREFAHAARPNRNPTDRVDFTETLYWSAGIKTDANTGEAAVSFALNDSVTTFRVFADGFNNTGALGAANTGIESVQPFYVEPKLPLEVTAGDTILLPLTVVNSIDSDLPGAKLDAALKGEYTIAKLPPFDLKPNDRARQIMKIDVGLNNGVEDFVLTASAGPYVDKVTRKLSVKPQGFPFETSFGGMIGPDKPASHSIVIPAGFVPRSVVTHIAVYPTPLANMTEALERLIQNPSGCFEQTSSTSYPLTMAQQYFLSHTGVNPKTVETARAKLDAGYKRLVGFWCPDRGYEWFGQDPGHEALTAFGVLHFSDMAQVREVDMNMVAQTRAWLLKQRDGKGGFERKRRALHTWIEDKDCSNAYIVWALLESGEKPETLATEIAALKTAAAQSQNSYVLALAGNVFALAGDKNEAAKLNARLVAKQNKEGGVDGGTATIVGSGGEALQIETTALASLAWMRDPAFAGAVEKSMKYLADSCKAGRYGSTQSTVLALRAIVTYDKQRAHPKAPGNVRVYVDGQSVGSAVPFDASTQGAITLPDVSELLGKGEHRIEIKMEGGAEMPYSLAVNYSALIPDSFKECKVGLDVQLATAEVVEGGITEINVAVTNKTKDAIPTPVAIIGLPGGLEPRHDQLKELVKKGTIDAYEVLGREVVLYWRGMAPEAKISVPLSLVAAVPGSYTGPASRAYLYYTDEHKQWVGGLKVTIKPK